MRIRPRLGLVLSLLLLVLPFSLPAQNQASVTGVVTDPSGAVIQNADVLLSNSATGVQFKATTNSVGSYHISNVPPGPGYTLSVSAAGFTSRKIDNIYVNVANVANVDAQLSLGGATEVVSVSAEGQGVTLNTEDATIGNNFQVSKLNDLPVQNRLTPTALFTMQPGITLSGATTGARTDQNYVSVDGLDVNDLFTGQFGHITGNAPVDSVQEFRGTVAGVTANSGFGSGGQFQLVTKSGSNQWHGQVNEYHRDNSTTANDWFNNNVGIRAPKLVQNQFGGAVGGPIKHDKAFFFFDYTNSRIAQDASILRTVPLPSYTAGNISYINDAAGCSDSSRQNTTPDCISTLSPAQVQQLDPAAVGESPAFLALLQKYPAANDLTSGDGINTGGFRFNSPIPTYTTTYVGKLDYNLSPTIHLFGVGNFTRENQVNGSGGAAQFPGLPPATQFVDRSYRYAVGMDWQPTPNMTNQVSYGSVVEDYAFPRPANPLGVNQISFSSGTEDLIDSPYSSPSNSQSRHVPIPQITDNFAWNKGRHTLSLGGQFKWIHPLSNTVLDYNSYTIGLGGEVQGLDDSMRPADLLPASSTAQVTYDSAFTAALGRVAAIGTTVNYDASGNPIPQGSGSHRSYRYNQVELYALDSFKITPRLTLTYGVNYQYFTVPYETNGLETTQPTLKNGGITFDQYMKARVAQSAASISGPNAVPFITYVLGGPKNHGPALYNNDPLDFAPRVSLDWNPGFDPNTVISIGAGMVYDRTVVNAVMYQQDQFSYLFEQAFTQNNGDGTDPSGSVATDPRYDNPPAAPVPTTPAPPFLPYVDDTGTPSGLQNGGAFNEMIDPNLKTPYSIQLNASFQHQFPGSTLLRISYAGRLGRRLLAQADANQLVDFTDPTSGEKMSTAMAHVTTELRAGADPSKNGPGLPAEGWFENQIQPGRGAARGYANNTSYLATALQSLMIKGDFADTIQALSGLLDYNVGMGAQFSENTFYTNKGYSSYNGLLVTVQKNLSHGLQFDANYTWSHSLDNTSLIANEVAYGGYGFICDDLRPRLCRGNSDFDTTHYVTGDFTYSLPFGHGRAFGGSIPLALDELIGGWDISGLPVWHSGTAYSTVSSAFIAGYANNAPGIFNGDTGALKHKVHKDDSGQLFLYADPNAAVNAFTGPVGFQIGSRNNLRGPQYFDLDSGLAKTFRILPNERLNFQFRADAFNVLNHPNFDSPGNNTSYDDITQASTFGQLTSMNGNARVLQLSGRLQF